MNKQKNEGCQSTPETGSPKKYCSQKVKYQIEGSKSSKNRSEQIENRRKEIPDIHQANYGKAMKGKSMKAGIKTFCLMCVCWQKEEVRLCTDLACPLYPYRPYRISKQASEEHSFITESTNKNKGGI